MTARTLMVQGTMSNVGKSLIVGALCRLFVRDGVSVAPFKAQNMSLNAAVTPDGREIGRAQAQQAMAARVPADALMNPILLKPMGGMRSQLVLHGKAAGVVAYADYKAAWRTHLRECVAALEQLRARHDLVILEGAGGAAEINLRGTDIVNMRMAAASAAPVLLVGNIDPGGVFAQLYGTVALQRRADRARIAGLIINNLRGDPTILAPGIRELERRARSRVIGVVPHVESLRLAEEDSLGLGRYPRAFIADGRLRVAVVALPHIANFDDIDPLMDAADCVLTADPAVVRDADLVVLPGTRTTIEDLGWLRGAGLADAVLSRPARGLATVGLCGGYQMLGNRIDDPDRVESAAGYVAGLGLLDVTTTFFARKETQPVVGVGLAAAGLLGGAAGASFWGYEIHHGETDGSRSRPWIRSEAGTMGAISDDGRTAGCYVHGLFDSAAYREGLLAPLARRLGRRLGTAGGSRDSEIDRLADVVSASLDMGFIRSLVWKGGGGRDGD